MVHGMLRVGGFFVAERYSRDGKLISRHRAKNGITDAGLNDLLDVYFRQQANSTWRIGLIDNLNFDELDDADTIASHAGWNEITAYSEANRPLWGPGAAAGKLVINSAAVVFTMTAAKTVNGIFCVNEGTKGGATGLLFSTASFDITSEPYPLMEIGEALRVTYQVSAEGR